MLSPLGPARYVGVDIEPGPRVDQIVDAARVIDHFGANTFDVVITTEMLEHVRDWRTVVANLKGVLRPGGVLLITTRSIGFRYHGYPHDYWRFEPVDMERIFRDFDILRLERDPAEPGVFMLARKPRDAPTQATDLKLHSIITGRRQQSVRNFEVLRMLSVLRARRILAPVWDRLPARVRTALTRRVRTW